MDKQEKKEKSVGLDSESSLMRSVDEEAESNEDRSLKIVEKAMIPASCSNVIEEEEAEILTNIEMVSGGIDKGFKSFCRDMFPEDKAKEKENVDNTKAMDIGDCAAEKNPVGVSDNAVLRRLLRGPRYFDTPDKSWGTCYNCGEEGHAAVNCTSARRKKPCFVCGSFEHNAKQCAKGKACFICKKGGHRANDCPERSHGGSQSSKICLKCGDSGHEMFSCRNNYSNDDLKEILCYICKSFGHLCCAKYPDSGPREFSCYRCGLVGHTGLACTASRAETSCTGSLNPCYRCGEEGHFARECTNPSRVNKRKHELSTPKKKVPKKRNEQKEFKSVPRDFGRAWKKKGKTEGGYTSGYKVKRRGGWVPDDLEDYPQYGLLSLANNFSLPIMEEDKQNQVARIQDFDPPKKPKTNKYAIACTFLASLSSILLGYDIGVMSGAILYIKKDLHITDVQVEILVGILNVYSLFGSAAAGRTSDWIGRRYTMVVAAGIFFAGALLMGFATTYAFLMFGRFVAGVGVGYALMVAPVYTAEVSPASSRGFLTSFPEVFINFGILMGYVSNVVFSKLSTHLSWRFMLGIGAIPSVFLAVSVLAMPESPRWLVMQGRLGDARRVLNKTSDSLQEAQFRLADIKQAAGIPENCNDDIVEVPKRPTGDNVWKELVFSPTPAVRHILITGVGIHFFQQASGIDAVVLYSPKIFEKAGIKSDHDKLLCTVAVGVVKTLFILVATFMLDRSGRRRLLLTSVGGMVASLVLLATGLTIIEHSEQKLIWAIALCIAMVLAYVALFSIGMGPITWVYSSEIFPLRLRATGCSIGVAVNRVTSGVVSMTFLSLEKAITIGAAFFLYAALAAVALVFFYTLMPETQGKTLEEMETLFGTFWNWRARARELKELKKTEKNSNDNGHIPMGTSNALAMQNVMMVTTQTNIVV